MKPNNTFFEYSLSAQRKDFYNITPQVQEAVVKSGIVSGIAVIYCPHTTAGITPSMKMPTRRDTSVS